MKFQTLHDELVIAMAIMDEKGRESKGGRMMLWLTEWEDLRDSLLKCLNDVKAALATMEGEKHEHCNT